MCDKASTSYQWKAQNHLHVLTVLPFSSILERLFVRGGRRKTQQSFTRFNSSNMDLLTHAIPPSPMFGFVYSAQDISCYLAEEPLLSSSFKLYFRENMMAVRHTAIRYKPTKPFNDKWHCFIQKILFQEFLPLLYYNHHRFLSGGGGGGSIHSLLF